MDSKVSVVIPNYNAEKYISNCIDSVLSQTYRNIDIIIIDDGSTDDSWNIIKKYSEVNQNITIVKQYNMNASIARNKGIEIARGKYILFLDSDDMLFENAIELLVQKMEKSSADLVMGDFVSIDSQDSIIHTYKIAEQFIDIKVPFDISGCVPNPSNKMYKLDIIKKHSVYFGNVRIGQDLNFFLKYLLFCNTVQVVNSNIYMWRKVETSISNTYSFKIFDITESFKDIKKYYYGNNASLIYEKYIKMIEYRHYYLQMEKQKYFKDKKARLIVVNFFKYQLGNLDVIGSLNFRNYKNDYLKSRIKMFFKILYVSRIYYWIDEKFARR